MKAKKFLILNKIATINELKIAMKTDCKMTVFRKLKTLGYLSSYSHRGKHYTLDSIPDFNQSGLWVHNSIWFSTVQDNFLKLTG